MLKKFNRKDFLKYLGAAAGAGTVGFLGIKSVLRSDGEALRINPPEKIDPDPVKLTPGFVNEKPNIIIINCDDMGYGDLGCYGNSALRTANIDRLSATGVRFSNFYASSSVCTPSRYSLLTGRYPVRSGLIFVLSPQNEAFFRKYFIRGLGRWMGSMGAVDTQDESYADGIADYEITLASALKVAGYRTGMVGKWHLGDFHERPEYNPIRHGFDRFFGVPYSNDMSPFPLYRNDRVLETDFGSQLERLTALYTKESIDFITKSKEQRFFLYLAHTFPHQPLHASAGFKNKSKAGIYGDAVEEIDWSTGEIMKCLRRCGIENNTIVIFTSDNGPWYNGSTGVFRGRKGQSYEGGFRVPFIACWPGFIPAGSVCPTPAMNIDLFPTLLSLAGLRPPADRVIDGKNIVGLMQGRDRQTPHAAFFFYHYEELEGVRVDDWKYFRNINHYVWPQPVDKPTHVLGKIARGHFGDWPNLYNLAMDPAESYNLASRYPEICKKMEKVMMDWEETVRKNPGGWLRSKHA